MEIKSWFIASRWFKELRTELIFLQDHHFSVFIRPGKHRVLRVTDVARFLNLVEMTKAHLMAKVKHLFRVSFQ